MLRVTVQLKRTPPIKIECIAYNDIVYHTDMICVHNLYEKWCFMKNELEYVKIERIKEPCQ